VARLQKIRDDYHPPYLMSFGLLGTLVGFLLDLPGSHGVAMQLGNDDSFDSFFLFSQNVVYAR
jgi:hypothetical protein